MSLSPEVFIGEFRPWPDSVHVVRGRTGEKVKPCPFCGGEAHAYRNNLWHVGCEHAHNGCVTMSEFVTKAEAIAAWNTRASETPNRERIIELVEELSDLVGGV